VCTCNWNNHRILVVYISMGCETVSYNLQTSVNLLSSENMIFVTFIWDLSFQQQHNTKLFLLNVDWSDLRCQFSKFMSNFRWKFFFTCIYNGLFSVNNQFQIFSFPAFGRSSSLKYLKLIILVWKVWYEQLYVRLMLFETLDVLHIALS
jgi:hypothetical protein